MEKVYIVFTDYSYEYDDGFWDNHNNMDSVWSNKDDAKSRIHDLANQYKKKQWYEAQEEPDLDYKETWNDDGTDVCFKPSSYEEISFYIMEESLRSGWPHDHEDLPDYYDITVYSKRKELTK